LLPLFVISGIFVSYGMEYKNAIYLEALGDCFPFSLNYERFVDINDFQSIAGRIGFGGMITNGNSEASTNNENISAFTSSTIMLPISIRYLLGQSPHHGEIGIGFIRQIKYEKPKFARTFIAGSLAYRYSKRDSKIFVRIAFTPIYNPELFLPLGGISLGFIF
jgi:hypothetical protein